MIRNIVVGCVLVLVGAGVSLGEEGFYVSAHGGPGVVNKLTVSDTQLPGERFKTKPDVGPSVLGAFGYDFGRVRLEGEGGYQSAGLDKMRGSSGEALLNGNLSVAHVLANAYVDFGHGSLVPFVTAGCGMAVVDLDRVSFPGSALTGGDDRDSVFAWQLGIGAGWEIDKHWTCELLYRYFATADADLGTTTMEFASHNLYLGLRYNF
jgi:OmpA-OmpF porin, OOP family